jgi:hypothetical protein
MIPMTAVWFHPSATVTAAVESSVETNRIESDVYDALAAADDGHLYVVIVLADAVGPQNADPVARADTARTQQQVVLDTLDATEFDLVHRPDDVAGLTGRINASGLDKLAELDVVARVGVDVMQSGCADLLPDQCDEKWKDGSLFALTKARRVGPVRGGETKPVTKLNPEPRDSSVTAVDRSGRSLPAQAAGITAFTVSSVLFWIFLNRANRGGVYSWFVDLTTPGACGSSATLSGQSVAEASRPRLRPPPGRCNQMTLRCLLLAAAMTMLATAAAHATFVELSILGQGGADTVTIGPQGGTVPYTLFAETDPIGTFGNLGLARLNITIDSDIGVAQDPVQPAGLPPEVFLTSVGSPQGDDITNIFIENTMDQRAGFSSRFPAFGQSGPQSLAAGILAIPAAPPGTEFHASIFTQSGAPSSSFAFVFTSAYSLGPPDDLIVNTLTVEVIPEPSMLLLGVVATAMLGSHHMIRRRKLGT